MVELLELHSAQVFITNKSVDASYEIYGRIIVDDCPGDYNDVFNADKQHAISIPTDGVLPLSGPPRCIRGGMCSIAVSLKEKDHDLEVANGTICFEFSKPIDYNRPISIVVKGEHGYAVFHVSLFKLAQQGILEVVFLPKEGRPKPREYSIFGQISAQYSSYTYNTKSSIKYHQTKLFDIARVNAMTFDAAKVIKIPLSRPAVAVSWNKWLVIDANLCVSDSGTSSEDYLSHSVSGIALFFPIRDGCTTVEHIQGDIGDIKVSASWSD